MKLLPSASNLVLVEHVERLTNLIFLEHDECLLSVVTYFPITTTYLFENIEAKKIIDFIKETHFYKQH